MSRRSKLLILSCILFVAAGVVYRSSGRSLKELVYGYKPVPSPQAANSEFVHEEPLAELPPPLGPEKAPVRVIALLRVGEPCPMPLVHLTEQLHARYPTTVRMVYRNMTDAQVQKFALNAKISCKMGLLVNGKNEFRIKGRQPYEVVMFQGPPHTAAIPNSQMPSASQQVPGYTAQDVYTVIDQILQAKGLKPGKIKPKPGLAS